MTARQDLIAARLRRIADDNGGRLTADAVVADAKSADSPLHDQFEWDDSIAADRYRIEQARTLIRSVRIEITVQERTIGTVAYVRDPDADRTQGYTGVTELRDDPDRAQRALHREIESAGALLERVESLAAAFDLQEEARDVRTRFERFAGLFNRKAENRPQAH